MCRAAGFLLVSMTLLGLPGTGRAHPLLDEGIELYETADFLGALGAFDAAADEELSIDELVTLYEMRALLHRALGDQTAMVEDLERVIAIRPTHSLTRLAPPTVRRAFDEIVEMQGPGVGGELVLGEHRVDGDLMVAAIAERVPSGIVHYTNVRCTVGDDERKRSATAQGGRVELRLPNHGFHDGCEASAYTKRGDVLFEASLAPTSLSGPRHLLQAPASEHANDGMSKKKKKRWLWIAAGITVAVAGSVTAGVVLSRKSGSGSEPGTVLVSW